MHAIFSDIHGNLEALNAVLAKIDDCGVVDLICLGDLIGYGPDSMKCLRIASQWPVVIAGDWDRSLVNYDPTQWNPTVSQHIEWIREQLSSAYDADVLMAAARNLRTFHKQYGCLFTHGTPYDAREFLFPEDVYCPTKLDRIATEFDSVIFVGHTHIPGLFARNGGNWTYLETDDGHQCDITNYDKLICNVGSVGQPRDGDRRASFVLFDGRIIQFQRIEYDFQATIAKIEAIPEIDNIQGNRLAEGR